MTRYHDQPSELGAPLGLYSHIASAPPGRMIAIAGQTGVTIDGELAGDHSVRAQTVQAFSNLKAALASAGAKFGDVFKTTTYLVDRSSIDPFMKARRLIFADLFPDGRYPPNTLLIVSGLVEERFLVEIEAFALTSETGE